MNCPHDLANHMSPDFDLPPAVFARRPYWFCRTHEKALATLTNEWTCLNELLGRGFGTLCLCELEHLQLIERKLEPLPHRNALPSDFQFYRLAQKL